MIIVTGARGVVGVPVCDLLARAELDFLKVSRTADGIDTIRCDLSQPIKSAEHEFSDCHAVIHCAPLWLLPTWLEAVSLPKLDRLIVFSSTSVISKTSSSDHAEQVLVRQLAEAEASLTAYATKHSINLTILRPSMIYGHGRDQNIMTLARFIRQRGFMLLAGRATGKRQPVHADDLANLVVRLINKTPPQLVYNLAGAEVLSYSAMVRRIFKAMGKSPRIFHLPVTLYRVLLKVLAKIGSFHFTAEMANRMNQDLVFDNTDAIRDLGFEPREFLLNPAQDLRFAVSE